MDRVLRQRCARWQTVVVTFDEAVTRQAARLVPRWTLHADEWPRVDAALGRLRASIASGSAREVTGALAQAGRLGLTRLSAAGGSTAPASTREAPPPAVLELVNTLVHPSDGWTSRSQPPSNVVR